jgi:hypothetical protein
LRNPVEKTGVKAGLLTFLCLVTLFFLVKTFFRLTLVTVHLFYIPALAIGIWYGILRLKKKVTSQDFYLKGFAEGIYVSFIAVLLFAAFLGIYLQFVDFDLLKSIRADRTYISGFSIFTVLSIEGVAWGLIISLVIMDYFE